LSTDFKNTEPQGDQNHPIEENCKEIAIARVFTSDDHNIFHDLKSEKSEDYLKRNSGDNIFKNLSGFVPEDNPIGSCRSVLDRVNDDPFKVSGKDNPQMVRISTFGEKASGKGGSERAVPVRYEKMNSLGSHPKFLGDLLRMKKWLNGRDLLHELIKYGEEVCTHPARMENVSSEYNMMNILEDYVENSTSKELDGKTMC
jgi:hypothetical protein